MSSPKGEKTLVLKNENSDTPDETVPRFNWEEFQTGAVFQSIVSPKGQNESDKIDSSRIISPTQFTPSVLDSPATIVNELNPQIQQDSYIYTSTSYVGKGTVLGNRYEVKEMLGEGGFGKTYLVTDEEDYLKTEWVLKLLDSKRIPDGDVAKFIQKLKSQYKAWKYFSDTSPDSIVRLLSVRKLIMPWGDETVGLLMEYMPGGDLLDILKVWQPTSNTLLIPSQIDSLLIYFKQICESVLALHSENFLHRDLKPSNIFLADDKKKCKLGDFDLLLNLKQELLNNTVSFEISGTPNFMAPEAFEGKFTELSDIFSIGATFYYCLSGRYPFEGNSIPEMLIKLISGTRPKPLSEINPLIPHELDQLILRCLETKPEDRPANVKEILSDLNRIGNFAEDVKSSPLSNAAPVMLAELLLKVLGKEDRADLIDDLKSTGYRSKREFEVHEEQDLIEEYCYTVPPDQILLERLTKPQLKKLASLLNIDTVKLNSREEIIKVILPEIGFLCGIREVPGIEATRIFLEKSFKNFANINTSNDCIGILNPAFTSIEIFITLLIRFYGQLCYGASFETQLAPQANGKKEKWTFGEKTKVLKKLSDSISAFPEKAKSVFSKNLFSQEIFNSLKDLSDHRNSWSHHETEPKSFNEMRRIGQEFLTIALQTIKKIKESKNFPRVVQIISSEEDVYGRHFYYGQDDSGRKEKIFTPHPLGLGEIYLFFPLTNPARINPLIFPYEHKDKKK